MGWALVSALATGLAVVAWRRSPLARLRQRASPTSLAGRSRQRVVGALAVAVSALLSSFGVGWWSVPVALALGGFSYLMLGRLATGGTARRRAGLIADLPQTCDLLAVCLESGLPLRRAVELLAEQFAGPIRDVLAELSAKVRLGADEGQAWAELAEAEPALAPLAREVARTVGSGVALSRTLRVLGLDARREAFAAAEVRAKRVGVASVLPLMICFLPSFLLLGVVPIIGGVVQHLIQ